MTNLKHEDIRKDIKRVGQRLADFSQQVGATNEESSVSDSDDGQIGTLHLYGQAMCHDPAIIVGDKVALKKLRDQINEALTVGVAVNDGCDYFQSDGEGFVLTVVVADGNESRLLSSAYSDELSLPGDNAIQPADLIKNKLENR